MTVHPSAGMPSVRHACHPVCPVRLPGLSLLTLGAPHLRRPPHLAWADTSTQPPSLWAPALLHLTQELQDWIVECDLLLLKEKI